jgi:hypothetical protein
MSSENFAEKQAKLQGLESGLPTSEQLYEIFGKVLAKWAYLPSEYAGIQAGPSAVLSLEQGVYLTGAFKGTLVVRADAAIGQLLVEAALGDASDADSAADSFREIINVFCGHFLTTCWRSISFGSFLPVPISRPSWPAEEPSVSCLVSVEGRPLEIRFWIDSSDRKKSA